LSVSSFIVKGFDYGDGVFVERDLKLEPVSDPLLFYLNGSIYAIGEKPVEPVWGSTGLKIRFSELGYDLL